jgi:FOG: GGDEF domain
MKVIGSGDDVKYYSLEKRVVAMDNSEVVGSFISIRDNTEEQKNLRQEIYSANHDRLTGLYTKEYLYKSVERKLKQNPDTDYIVGYVDVKNFKIVNDIFGSNFGDYSIQCIAKLVNDIVPSEGLTGRLAGDTFGIAMPAALFNKDAINQKLSDFIVKSGKVEHRIMVHIGVYEVTEKNIDGFDYV